jgi:NifU-like protein involved in Fe-S cluster formation
MAVLRHPVYSSTVMEHFTSPRSEGRLARADAQGWAGPAEAPHQVGIQLGLKYRGIARVGYTLQERTPLRVAAASVLCQWAYQQSVDTAATFTMAGLAARMEGIPDTQHHEVALVFEAFQQAVAAAQQVLATRPGVVDG